MSPVLTQPPPSRQMSLEEFHALPDAPAVDRMLLFGELVERPMTKRNRWHSGCEAAIAHLLETWNRSLTPRPGKVFSGEAGCDLPVVDSGVGIDVAYFSNEVLDAQDDESKYIVGPPVLAVEILSLSDIVEDIHKKVKAYLQAGVKRVWVVDPYDQTVTVHRPSNPPEMLVTGQTIEGGSDLPGLNVAIDEIFE